MTLYKRITELTDQDKDLAGPKAVSLGRLANSGFKIPEGLSITTEAYRIFIKKTDLDKKIVKEIKRKELNSMRWEEIWDTQVRIKSLFNNTAIPSELRDELTEVISKHFNSSYTAVRSSSPSEDSQQFSFAGLHDSYIKIKGAQNILKHIKLVWSSLFSTASLIYRKDDPNWVENSAMAVIVQKLVKSKKSGVIFTIAPSETKKGKIESVWGYNKGLVDGKVEPFSWKIDRNNFELTDFDTPEKSLMLTDPIKDTLEERKNDKPPLNKKETVDLFKKALKIEKASNSPQDIEWTDNGKNLFFLQARPITSIDKTEIKKEFEKDKLLKPEITKLFKLKKEIEERILPGLKKDIKKAEKEISENEDFSALLEYADNLLEKYLSWKKEYWDYLIPFAHGIRIFGDIYNERLAPEDPQEYIKVLESGDMLSVKRNRKIAQLARLARRDDNFYKILSRDKNIDQTQYSSKIKNLLELFRKSSTMGTSITTKKILGIIKQYADTEITKETDVSSKKALA